MLVSIQQPWLQDPAVLESETPVNMLAASGCATWASSLGAAGLVLLPKMGTVPVSGYWCVTCALGLGVSLLPVLVAGGCTTPTPSGSVHRSPQDWRCLCKVPFTLHRVPDSSPGSPPKQSRCRAGVICLGGFWRELKGLEWVAGSLRMKELALN